MVRVRALCNMYENHVNYHIGEEFEVDEKRLKALGDKVQTVGKPATPEIERPKAAAAPAKNRMVKQAPEIA